MHIKTYGIIEKLAKLSDGEVEFVVSTNALDAHGERIDVDGISLKEYKKNPVVLWSHDGFNLPIAKATKIWKDGKKLMARAQFDMSDDFPRKVYRKIMDGFLSAVSIGGMVDEWGDDGITIKKLNMKEFSVVSVPANQEALVAQKTMTPDDKLELHQLATAYARKLLATDSDVVNSINTLENMVTTLKEVAQSETDSEQVDVKTRIVLRQAQAVDKQAERIIVTLKNKDK